MFERIELTGLKDSPLFGYAYELAFFKKKRKVDFKPGLNILFGPNGCGKSTVLNILGTTMCAVQGGLSSVTEDVVHKTVDMAIGLRRAGQAAPMLDKIGLKVVHDGQGVLYVDPRKATGLTGGHFDNDFMAAGVRELTEMRTLSHGQASYSRTNAAVGVLLGKLLPPGEVRQVVKKANVNSVWVRALEVLETRMAASIPTGQFTVLLDEPESNFSLRWQGQLWALLARPDVAQRLQVIVASHSPFALGIPHANYIDMGEPNYRDEVEGLLRAKFGATEAA